MPFDTELLAAHRELAAIHSVVAIDAPAGFPVEVRRYKKNPRPAICID